MPTIQEWSASPIHYWNTELGINMTFGTEFREYDDPRRVQLLWEGLWKDGELGWNFGSENDPPRNYYSEWVKWDDGEISGVHPSHLSYI